MVMGKQILPTEHCPETVFRTMAIGQTNPEKEALSRNRVLDNGLGQANPTKGALSRNSVSDNGYWANKSCKRALSRNRVLESGIGQTNPEKKHCLET